MEMPFLNAATLQTAWFLVVPDGAAKIGRTSQMGSQVLLMAPQ